MMKIRTLTTLIFALSLYGCGGSDSSSNKTSSDDTSAEQNVNEDTTRTSETGCSSDHPHVGYTGEFNTFSHDVAGTATIIDDCTIELTNFSYDGGGPAVYFYGGIGHQYTEDSAFIIGDLLTGTVYSGDTVSLTLPEGKTFDDLTGIGVWCVDFAVDFGNVEFLMP